MSQKCSGKSVSSLYLINIHSDTSSIHTQASLQCTPPSASSSTVFIRPFPSSAWPRTAVSCFACIPCLRSAPHSAFLLGMYLIMSYGHLRTFSSFPLGTSAFSSFSLNTSVAYLMMVRLLHAEDGLVTLPTLFFCMPLSLLCQTFQLILHVWKIAYTFLLHSSIYSLPSLQCLLSWGRVGSDTEESSLSGHRQVVYARGCHSCIE